MYRTHTCGELRLENAGQKVTLAGWVQRVRKMGGMSFIDLRDRYGITQIIIDESVSKELNEQVEKLGREYVIQVTGTVQERQSRNSKMDTGDVEVRLESLNVLNAAAVPPFTIEDESDGGDDLRMKYRYLDLRRNPLKKNLMLRHRMAHEVRNYLDGQGFMEIETPYLIKSTPEGARDFVVPSRMNPGQFYALPQSPQQQKQLLMVAGYDRYFQIVRCFRDEDLRADRQPEFTQIDCEMSFVERDDVLETFEGMIKTLFHNVLGKDFTEPFYRMPYSEAMDSYGSDKPDIRFGMKLHEITSLAHGHNFPVYSEGLFYACTDKAASPGFYDIEGNMVIDLSSYNMGRIPYSSEMGVNAPYFENGQATILFANNAGSVFEAVIDKTGAFVGEPEKVDVSVY